MELQVYELNEEHTFCFANVGVNRNHSISLLIVSKVIHRKNQLNLGFNNVISCKNLELMIIAIIMMDCLFKKVVSFYFKIH